ncbi:UbiA-like protein EboC [Mucilaginibacter auburnensis]|uniref:4-hydroxybenzoate polyprenyltransferase n=1 Tax=Mucilaginibacter auburnensis TaxID=1457233 RepID=A0A2H9VQT2_9SPHI|nr:UbiA-like protein EboC [Mucilaginibacter auburnensis]PJJ83192.1 4-hydroxybenzoate polyprenyltransferase [Mucilaginibacter auburnensis]
MASKAIAYLRMMRPANVVTSVADVLAGVAIAGYFTGLPLATNSFYPIVLLCLATMGLYAGGIVFNDVFDAELDKVERPERAIPSGLITVKNASALGLFLLLWGIGFGYAHSPQSGLIAVLIAFFALLYNRVSKHHKFFGPLNMGACRALNLLLGISIITPAIVQWFHLAIVPLLYIFSITMISRGEVHGGDKKNLYAGASLYLIVIFSIHFISSHIGIQPQNMLYTLIFLLPFAYMIFKPLIIAIKDPIGPNVGKAVKAGVISLILMNAAWAAAFGAIYPAIFIACLLPVSISFARWFAVT